MFRALRKLFGGNDTGVEFPPSKVFAMELLTKSLATSTTNDRYVAGYHAGFFIENRDLSEYIALMRQNSRSWAEQQDKVLFWNKESYDDAGMTENRNYSTGSIVQGIYVGRAKRLLNNIAKTITAINRKISQKTHPQPFDRVSMVLSPFFRRIKPISKATPNNSTINSKLI